MSASMLVSCVGVATHPGLCPIVKETASAAPTLCTEYGPNGWMDGLMDSHTRSTFAALMLDNRYFSVSDNLQSP